MQVPERASTLGQGFATLPVAFSTGGMAFKTRSHRSSFLRTHLETHLGQLHQLIIGEVRLTRLSKRRASAHLGKLTLDGVAP